MAAKKPNYEAMLQHGIGALTHLLKQSEEGVAVGHHDLCRGQIILTLPDFAGVDRAAGTDKDGKPHSPGDDDYGFDVSEPPKLELDPMAERLFLERILATCAIKGEASRALCLDCIRDAHRGMKTEPAAELLDALAQVQAALPPGDPVKRRTPAKRSGEKEVEITIKRLAKAAVE